MLAVTVIGSNIPVFCRGVPPPDFLDSWRPSCPVPGVDSVE